MGWNPASDLEMESVLEKAKSAEQQRGKRL